MDRGGGKFIVVLLFICPPPSSISHTNTPQYLTLTLPYRSDSVVVISGIALLSLVGQPRRRRWDSLVVAGGIELLSSDSIVGICGISLSLSVG